MILEIDLFHEISSVMLLLVAPNHTWSKDKNFRRITCDIILVACI